MKRKMSYNEYFVVFLVVEGYLTIDFDGKIWRVKGEKGFSANNPNREKLINKTTAEEYTQRGYFRVKVMLNGIIYRAPSHRVIWLLHNGFIPEGYFIHHKNGIKTDNRLENLDAVTNQQNLLLAIADRPNGHWRAKLNKESVLKIRELYEQNHKQSNIAKMFNVGDDCIHDIVHRISWKHI